MPLPRSLKSQDLDTLHCKHMGLRKRSMVICISMQQYLLHPSLCISRSQPRDYTSLSIIYHREKFLEFSFSPLLLATMAASKDQHPSMENKDIISAHVEHPAIEMTASEDPTNLLAHDSSIYFTVEEERRVLRKIDMRVLPLMLGAYFLQQLDKSSLSYTSVFNIQKDAGLVGRQYSWLGSILYIAQLVMQPLGALLLVKLPTGKVISIAICLWGVTMCGMAGCRNFKQLLATRFLLGSFESLIGWSSSYTAYHITHSQFRSIPRRCNPDVVASQRTNKQNLSLERNERDNIRLWIPQHIWTRSYKI
jgi:hypothetical protein